MLDEIPSLAASWGGADDERALALAAQASLPSDLVAPAEALGEDQWKAMVDADVIGGGENALEEFRYGWDWGMTLQQKADMLATAALDREMKAYIRGASDAAVKPPVNPEEFAGKVVASRMERARRV